MWCSTTRIPDSHACTVSCNATRKRNLFYLKLRSSTFIHYGRLLLRLLRISHFPSSLPLYRQLFFLLFMQLNNCNLLSKSKKLHRAFWLGRRCIAESGIHFRQGFVGIVSCSVTGNADVLKWHSGWNEPVSCFVFPGGMNSLPCWGDTTQSGNMSAIRVCVRC